MNILYTEDTMTYVRMQKYRDDKSNLPVSGREVYLYPMNFLPNNDKWYTYIETGYLFGYKVIAPQGTSVRPRSELDDFKDKIRELL